MARQTTVRKVVEAVGVSRVYQMPSRLRFRPAPPGTGIAFHRADRNACLAASLDRAFLSEGRLVLGRSPGQVEGVEHLLAAVVAQGLTDVFVELDGPEPPAFDGGASTFTEMLWEAGVATGRRFVPTLQVRAPFRWECEHGAVELRPAGSLVVEAREAGHDGNGQRVRLHVTPRSLTAELAAARCPTWTGASRAREALFGSGAAARRSWSPAGELHRHRTLELVGCLALLGHPLQAEVIVTGPGLDLALPVLRTALAQTGVLDLTAPGRPVPLWGARRLLDLDGVAAGLG